MSENCNPYEEKRVGDDVPEKNPDAELRLTDEGIEMPEFLKGYVGKFTMRTPSVTGEMETTENGLSDDDFNDGILASYPGDGDYNKDLKEGMLAFSTPDHPETVFKVVDERSEGEKGE